MGFDAIVLAGGASSRFGGVDKATVRVDGVPMLDRVLTATAAATTTVVVGPARATIRPVSWAVEDPPGGGPVAGILTGLAFGAEPLVGVFSCDLPWLTAADVAGLVDGIGDLDGFGLRDSSGHGQRLATIYRRTALLTAATPLGDGHDRAVRELIASLRLDWTAPTRAGDDVDSRADLT